MQIEELVTEANQGYANSKVYIRLILHCIERYLGEEGHGPQRGRARETLHMLYQYKVR